MSMATHFANRRMAFMQQTADKEPTLDQWKSWTDAAALPERHRQANLPGLSDSSLRRGFRRRCSSPLRAYVYSCQRRRPGRESRWDDRELRETDSFAVSVIPSPVLEEAHFSPADRRILLALILLSRGRESWTMYVAPIANMARVARSTAHLAVARLARAGYITRAENRINGAKNGPNTWTIVDARLLVASIEATDTTGRKTADLVGSSSFGDRVQKNDPVINTNIIYNSRDSTAKTDRLRSTTGHGSNGYAEPWPLPSTPSPGTTDHSLANKPRKRIER